MRPDSLSTRSDAADVFANHAPDYLAQLVAPMDDMWSVFAAAADAHAICIGGRVIGSCCVDQERRLLRFYVEPKFQDRAVEILRLVLRDLRVSVMMVFTLDPIYLSTALDIATEVEPDTLLFAHRCEPVVVELEALVTAQADQQARIVAFEVEAIGAPLEFLESYVGQRLERRELVLFEEGGQLVCVGELRRDDRHVGVAQLGVIVHPSARGRGLASRMLASLVSRSRAEGLTPHCSTEVANGAARKAIERAGFRANHRLLRVSASSPTV